MKQMGRVNMRDDALKWQSREYAPVKVKVLVVQFDFEIARREIPAFRAAVIEKVGRENVLFHNHMGKGFRYGYPLIQYKVHRHGPTIVCINNGSEEILEFFKNSDWTIVLNERRVQTRIKHLSYDYFYCGFSAAPVRYAIENWFALSEDNFGKFLDLPQGSEKDRFLEQILVGNIISFAKGIRWELDRRIELTIIRSPRQRFFNFKNHKMAGFDVTFSANVFLPDAIGLGKSVSRGFGVIRKVE